MKLRIAALAAVPLLTLTVACSSSSSSSSSTSAASKASASSSMSGTETFTAVATGSAAAANLNNPSSNAPLNFPEGTWAGPVSVVVKPFTLTGGGPDNGNGAATVTLKTPAGNVVLHHGANQVPGASNPNSPPPATWTKTGSQCYFTTTFSKGSINFVSGTGKFDGATSPANSGTYILTAEGYAPLSKGQTKCGFTTTGPVINDGAKVTFLATGPITIKG